MLSYTVFDGHVVLLENDRSLREEMAYRDAIDSALKGEHVVLVCPNYYGLRIDFRNIVKLCEDMGLVFKARRMMGQERISIGNGDIRFECTSSPRDLSYKRMCEP